MSTQTNFLDPLDTWENKKKDSYGLAFAQLISKEWLNGGMITDECEYGTRRDWVRNKRLMVRGKQDPKKYKDIISRQEGDLTYLNLDWRIINIPEKFTKRVGNGLKDDNYRLVVQSNDRNSLINKKKKLDMHRRNMRSLPLMQEAKEKLGIDLIPKGFIPEDEESLLLHNQIKERPLIEIAEELVIEYVKDTNRWNNIEDNKNKDLVEVGICAGRNWTDPLNGVKIEYVDVENLVHSHVNENDFSDAYYFGVMESVTIHDIQREGNFTDAQIREIAGKYASHTKVHVENINECLLSDLFNIKTDILRFAFKTNKNYVYKKSERKGGNSKVSKKDESFNPEGNSNFSKLESSRETWMEGTYIIDSEYIYNYKECENIIRDEQNKAISPFTVRATDIYQNQLHAFTDNIEPLADQMQYTHLKIQHITAELKPDLIEIDIDALANLPVKGKKTKSWETALNLMNVKGVVFTKRQDMGELGIKDKPGVNPKSMQQGSAIIPLLNVWAHYYNLIRDTTGIPEAVDGSLPHDSLLGVNQMAELASNTTTRHLVDAATDFNKRINEAISSRIHNIFRSKNSEHLKKIYTRAVGKSYIEALEVMQDRHLHDFGFTIQMNPTKQEMMDFKEDLNLALQDGTIDVEVKSEAQQIAKTNIKLAHQYLFFMRKKRNKERMKEEEDKAKFKSQNDMQAAQFAEESKTKSYALKKQIDLKYEQQLTSMELIKKEALQQIEAPVQDKQFEQEVYLKKLEVAGTFNIREFQEDRKDQRTKIQATQQSKMVNQRKNDNAAPIDFENNIFGDIFNTN